MEEDEENRKPGWGIIIIVVFLVAFWTPVVYMVAQTKPVQQLWAAVKNLDAHTKQVVIGDCQCDCVCGGKATMVELPVPPLTTAARK